MVSVGVSTTRLCSFLAVDLLTLDFKARSNGVTIFELVTMLYRVGILRD